MKWKKFKRDRLNKHTCAYDTYTFSDVMCVNTTAKEIYSE